MDDKFYFKTFADEVKRISEYQRLYDPAISRDEISGIKGIGKTVQETLDQMSYAGKSAMESFDKMGYAGISALESPDKTGYAGISALESPDKTGYAGISALESLDKTGYARMSALESLDKTGYARMSALESLDKMGYVGLSALETLNKTGNAEKMVQASFARIDYAAELARDIYVNKGIFDKSSLHTISESLKNLYDDRSVSSALQTLAVANTHISELCGATFLANFEIKSFIEDTIHWREFAKDLSYGKGLDDLVLRHHTSEMLSLSVVAQSKLTAIESYGLGLTAQANSQFYESAKLHLDEFSKSYNNLFESIRSYPANVVTFPPIVTSHPPIEMYWETRILEEIIFPEFPENDLETQEEHEFSFLNFEQPLEELLNNLDPKLNNLLKGARNALTSTNPDRARHFAVSLRELFTHVIHRLAPNDEVKKWSSDPLYFHNGKPTRKARILYITRQINCGALSPFLDVDVKAVLAMVDVLQHGTHGIISSLSPQQLDVLLFRMQSLLVFLLRLDAYN